MEGVFSTPTPQSTPKPASKAPVEPPEAPKNDDLREKVVESIQEAASLYGISENAVLTRYSTVEKDGVPMAARDLDHLMKSKKWAEVTLGKLRQAIKEARGEN
jgi:hypothetical protein